MARKRINSSSVRPDTYLVVIPLTVGERKEFYLETREIKKKRRTEIGKELARIDAKPGPASDMRVSILQEEYETLDTDLAVEVGYKVFDGRIIEWDWMDKEGNVLPIPAGNDLDILDSLEVKELEFIATAILGQSRVKKK